MGCFDATRIAVAQLLTTLVLASGCPPPPPGSSCSLCTIKKIKYGIADYPELAAGATITAVNMVEHVDMTAHCFDGTSRSPCPYDNTQGVSPRAPGAYSECMSQATDPDDTVRVTVQVELTNRDGSKVTKTEEGTVSGNCR